MSQLNYLVLVICLGSFINLTSCAWPNAKKDDEVKQGAYGNNDATKTDTETNSYTANGAQQSLALLDLLKKLKEANTPENRKSILSSIAKLDLSALKVDQLPAPLKSLLSGVDPAQIASGLKISEILQKSLVENPERFDALLGDIVEDFKSVIKIIKDFIADLPVPNGIEFGACGLSMPEKNSNECEALEKLATDMKDWCEAAGGVATTTMCSDNPRPQGCPPPPRNDTICMRNGVLSSTPIGRVSCSVDMCKGKAKLEKPD